MSDIRHQNRCRLLSTFSLLIPSSTDCIMQRVALSFYDSTALLHLCTNNRNRDAKTCCSFCSVLSVFQGVYMRSFATAQRIEPYSLWKLPMFHRCKPADRSVRWDQKIILSHVTSTNAVAVFLDKRERYFTERHSVNSPCVFAMEQLRAVFSNVQFTDNSCVFELLLE